MTRYRNWAATWTPLDRAMIHAVTDWAIVITFLILVLLSSHPTTVELAAA